MRCGVLIGTKVLLFVSYCQVAGHTIESCEPPENVEVDLDKGVWFFNKGKPYEQSFEIGRGVRVPEGGVLFGPMFVADTEQEDHMEACRNAQQELLNGTLTR